MKTEKEVTLGEFLRHEREKRGITIEQVASATKVGVRTLHALEADHFSELPARPFIRGFVTSYCRFIGLESKEILSRYDDFIQKKSAERPNREAGHSGYAFDKKDGEQQSRTVLLIAMVSFIVLGGLAMIFLKPSLRRHHHSHIDKLKASHSEESGPNAHPSPSLGPVMAAMATLSPQPSPVPSSTPVAVVEPQVMASPTSIGINPSDPLDSGMGLKIEEVKHKLFIKVLADVWVRYKVDERPIRKFIVRKNKALVLRAKDMIQFQFSNPNSVRVFYNSKKYDLASGQNAANLKESENLIVFPQDMRSKVEKNLGESKSLPATPDPLPEDHSPLPSPTP